MNCNVQTTNREEFEWSCHQEMIMFEVIDMLFIAQHIYGSKLIVLHNYAWLCPKVNKKENQHNKKVLLSYFSFVFKCEESHKQNSKLQEEPYFGFLMWNGEVRSSFNRKGRNVCLAHVILS